MRRPSLPTVLTTVLVALVPLLGSVPAASATPAGIAWSPCPEDPAASCGTLRLPVDWTKPGGPAFDLAVAKVPAADPGRRIGTLFVNPGGPGGSGVDYALAAAATFSPEVLQRFDIIGIDPRGVARSHPVVCSTDALGKPGDTALPRNAAELAALVRYNRQLAADCRKHTGPLDDHVDTASVARDIDAVRAALGEDQLNWYGASYGTLMGQLYAELFPGRIRSMVTDGNMDHSLGTWAFQLTEASFVQDSYDEFVAWCNRSTSCSLHGQDVKAIYAGLLAKADKGELTDPADGHVVSSWELLDITQFFFSRPRWTQLADLVRSLHTGQATAGARTAKAAFAEERKPKTHRAGQVELVEDVRPQFCQDWSLPVRDIGELQRLWRASNTAAPGMRTSVLAWVSMLQCTGWPGTVHNPQHRPKADGAPTILMLNGLHDPATGHAWALHVAAQLGRNARLVTYEGAGHTAYRRNECTRGTTHAYLFDLTVPAPGTRCAASDPA
jgi:pimeloyl-ACP methyl ester carboxylesterase